VDDDFSLKQNSLAIDRGIDPRTLGLNVLFDSIFEADFSATAVRPSDGNADRQPVFDIGAEEYPNQPPMADGGPDQTVLSGTLVTLNGSTSSDPEGAALTYQWTLLSQPAGSAVSLTGPTSVNPQFTPVLRGSYVIQLVVNDGELNSAPDTISVTVPNRRPTANAGGPYTGQVNTPIQFAGAGSDPDGDAVTLSWDFGDGGTGSGATPTHTYTTPGTFTVTLTVTDSFGALAISQTTATITAALVLNPIGNKTVNLGETLPFTVSASSPTGPVSLFVAPLPLPNNATFNAASGLFTFRPASTQVGSFQLTFTATSGGQSASETITVTVPAPDPAGVTALSGRILDANAFELGQTVPVVGATVSLLGTGSSAQSDANGNFTLSGIPGSSQIFDIATASPAPDGSTYAGFREDIVLISGVNNVVSRPFFLPRIAANSLTTVNPNFFTTVTNPDLGVTLRVPPNTAKDANGNNFTGQLSISVVPKNLTPAALPDNLDPGLIITIQPVGVTFSTPVPITFPNTDNLPPGSQVDIWSLDAGRGVFSVVGTGLVSADGTKIETISGGIRATDWHFVLPPAGFLIGPFLPITDSEKAGECPCTSTVQLREGSLKVDFSLPSYRSLGISRALRFRYNSQWANPQPTLPFDGTIPVRSAVPPTVSYKLSVAGIDQGTETFLSTSGFNENIDETFRGALSFDGPQFTTGLYPYRIRLTNNYLASRISSDLTGQILVRNESQSPFGAGWMLEGMGKLFTNSDGSLSVISHSGALVLFIPQETAPPFVNFDPPPGDFSTLAKNPDGSFTRTLKDGSKINFNSQGLQSSVTDRNGNTTGYSYNAQGKLIALTDPAGLVTNFSYSGNRISAATDPAGRITSFQHDSQGNLTRVTLPDGSQKFFGYDARRLMTSETDERGFSSQRQYDGLGRFVSGVRPDGTPASATNLASKGFVDLASGFGSATNPAPVTRPSQAFSTITDGKGNTTSFETDALGAITKQTDALGQTTVILRDANSNPTKITRPNGAVTTMTYDAKGNLLTSTDPIGATTTFTYEPVFNQVKTIRDPKGNLTTINYDLNGNPIEIIDALGNRTQMTYDARGLLTSVTSAVGTAVQTTTSFTYDASGNLLTTTNPKGDVTTLAYDGAGNVFRSTDAENRVTEFTYDQRNRLTTVLDADLKTTQYGYDAKGNLTQVRDAKNQVTTFAYDARDRLSSATNPLGLTETFTYDANGNLTATTNRNGQTIAFNYDALNRLINKTRPPTSTEVGNQATAFLYDTVGNLTSVSNPSANILNQYDLANRLVSSLSTTEAAASSAVIQINADTTIGANNLQFEGQSIVVNGRTLTVDGAHTFSNLILANGAVLTHSPTTATTVGKLDITVFGTLQVDSTSRIDVTGRGFLGGNQPGNPFGLDAMTAGFQKGATGSSGGGYGGSGGARNGVTNAVYGDFRNPNDPGSGAATFGVPTGNGGGLVRIVAQTVQLDGIVKADGGGASEVNAGGGSGGGVRIDVGVLRGTGTIKADGGIGGGNGGAGSGGRVAIYYQDITGFDVTKVTAFGLSGAQLAAPGTVYLQGPARDAGELIVDNNGGIAANETTPIFTIPAGSLNFSDLKIRRGAGAKVDVLLSVQNGIEISTDSRLSTPDRVLASTIRVITRSSLDSAVDISASSVEITGASVLGQLPTTGGLIRKLALNTESLIIDATSRIDVTGKGFLGGNQPGNPFGLDAMTVGFQKGATGSSGGGYGGSGGVLNGVTNAGYGDFRNPNEPGSGAATFGVPTGNGGGLIRIVAQTVQLDGIIKADGGVASEVNAGGGSGGGIRIDVGILRGLGSIKADGGTGGGNGGAGSGGRVAIYYQDITEFDVTNVTAFGLSGAQIGAPGTVYLQGPAREAGELIIDNNTRIAANETTPIFTIPASSLNFTALKIRRGARARVDALLNVVNGIEVSTDSRLLASDRVLASTIQVATRSTLDSIDINAATSFQVTDNSVIGQLATTGSILRKLLLNAQTLTIDATSLVDVTGKGFLGGNQPGNPFGLDAMTAGFQKGATGSSGGGYGGSGGARNGVTNAVYGDFTNPNEPGSGAATFGVPTGNGGGLIRIVAQTVQLDGIVKADGGGASEVNAGGGSGGGVRIDVGVLRGTGRIKADGGTGGGNGGGGGGGRVAVYYQDITGFDVARITVSGAVGGANGQNGTIYLEQTFAMLTPTFEEAPVMLALSPVEGKAGADDVSSGDPVRLVTLEGLSASQTSFQRQTIPDIHAMIANAMHESASGDRPQRRLFDSSILNPRSLIVETPANLYLAIVANGKLKPFATTATASQGTGVSGALADNPKPVLSEVEVSAIQNPKSKGLTPSEFDNPKSKIENPKLDDLDPIYTYDLNGNRISMIDPTGLTTYTYDALNRLTSLTNNKGQVTSFSYDALGRRTSMTHANGVVTSYQYDAASQLTRLAHQLGAATINNFDYAYDRVGNRTSKTSSQGVHDYTYDTLNRLTQAVNPLPTNPLESFTYDPVGNRTNSNQNGASTFNVANQLFEDSAFTYQYDANGNLIQKRDKISGIITTYEYDAENKLVRVVTAGKTVNYRYDGLGRRVEKETVEVGTTTTRYVYDNEDILLELNGSNTIVARYTHGPGIDEPLIMEKGGDSFFYHADGLGSITEMTDSAGTLKQRYTYSSFGKIESQLDPNFVQPYAFTSREFDAETGLYFYRARYYDPLTGRFLQEDPLNKTAVVMFLRFARNLVEVPSDTLKELSRSPERSLLYAYVGNNPINLSDPLGLIDLKDPRVKGIIGTLVDLLLDEVEKQLCPGTTPKALVDLVQGIVGAESAAYLTIGAIGVGLSAVTIAATPVAVVGGLIGAGTLAVMAGNEAARSAANLQEAIDYLASQIQ